MTVQTWMNTRHQQTIPLHYPCYIFNNIFVIEIRIIETLTLPQHINIFFLLYAVALTFYFYVYLWHILLVYEGLGVLPLKYVTTLAPTKPPTNALSFDGIVYISSNAPRMEISWRAMQSKVWHTWHWKAMVWGWCQTKWTIMLLSNLSFGDLLSKDEVLNTQIGSMAAGTLRKLPLPHLAIMYQTLNWRMA